MELERYVRNILDDIKRRGIDAVREYAVRFDDYRGELRVRDEEFEEAERTVSKEDKEIIERIFHRLWRYHERQRPRDMLFIHRGSLYGLIYRPIGRIGIYVPGGRPLPSTLLMVGVPARIAGVRQIVVTSPPKRGKLDPHVLYIAKLLGVDEVYKLGGVQAIGAMAYGIGMKKVDKIFGPGNRYVNEAKRQVFGIVGIDSLAGPSEIAIIADESATKEYVLADLLAQREHGEDSRAWLLTTSPELGNYCQREEIEVLLCNDLQECVHRANEIAPEHLELLVRNPMELLPMIENAGAVYMGPYTPVAAADYFLGVNHVLPTGGAARFSGVLTVLDFLKPMSVAEMCRDEFLEERELGTGLAEIEGMEYHRRSLEVRK